MNVIAKLSPQPGKEKIKAGLLGNSCHCFVTALTTCVCSLVASGNVMLVSFLGEDYGMYAGAYKSLLLIPAFFWAPLFYYGGGL